jgi:hypothetical protein
MYAIPETLNWTPLLTTPPTVTTTGPVDASDGTDATIVVSFQPVGEAWIPLKVIVLSLCTAPKLDPLIVMDVPIEPAVELSELIIGAAKRVTVVVDARQLLVSLDSATTPRSSAHAAR